MSLTKVTYAMIQGASVNALDYMTDAQRADVASGAASINVAGALQAALDAAGDGPMSVYLPAGIYRITSQLVFPKGVVLYGCGSNAGPRWNEAALAWDKSEFGSVIAIDFGSGGSAVANSALYMTSVTGVQGVNFWHPNQSVRTTTPAQYPPTIGLAADPSEFGSKCFCTTITNCIFINSWIAINATVTHENLYVSFCGISAFNTGIIIDNSTDVDRLQSLNFNNTYTYLGNFPANDMFLYTISNAGTTGIRLGRADAIHISHVNIIAYHTGIRAEEISGTGPSGVYISACNVEGQVYSFVAEGFFQFITIENSTFDPLRNPLGGVVGQDALTFKGDVSPAPKSRSVSLYNVSVPWANNAAIWVQDCVFVNIDGGTFAGGMRDFGFDVFAIYMYSNDNVSVRNISVATNPNYATSNIGFINDCDNVLFNNNSFTEQQNANGIIYAQNSNAIRIVQSIVNNVTAPLFTTGPSVTNSFAETPINEQGVWTPVLNSFPAVPTTVQQKFTQSGLQVYVSMVFTFASPQTFVAGTSYVTGLPVDMWDDAAFSCGDGNDLASYGNAVGIAATNRIYVPAATSVDRLVISGSYAALAA